MKTTKTSKKIATETKSSNVKKPGNECLCGCQQITLSHKSNFMPGHDHSALSRAMKIHFPEGTAQFLAKYPLPGMPKREAPAPKAKKADKKKAVEPHEVSDWTSEATLDELQRFAAGFEQVAAEKDAPAPAKRKPGRPKGSKNAPKAKAPVAPTKARKGRRRAA